MRSLRAILLYMIITSGQSLTQKQIIKFWTPLAAMWILMGIEQPIINAFIARMDHMKENLAAFGIAFSLSLIIEGPIIQMLTAGAALGSNRGNYEKLIKFMHFWGAGLTAVHLLIALTPLYQLIVGGLMGAPEELMTLSQRAFLMMAPWTAAIGYRRLWQGILIRHGRTASVPLIMVSRMVVVFGFLLMGVANNFLPGAVLGGLALTLGVLVSGGAAYLFVRPVIAEIKEENGAGDFSWGELFKFYMPLALTSFIVLAARPIITAGLSRGSMPLESLALWPVASSFLFLFQSIPLSYQEVVVTSSNVKRTGKF